ncbi:hypothetical protein ACFQH6_08245 [Halobacteriaceae archaeon GCM10025711]
MSESDREELSEGLIFDVLSNPRRRYVLYYLRRHEESAKLKEIADQIAAWENDLPVEELSSQQRKRVYVSLYQTHIPKLESAGIVDYDENEGIVSLAQRADEVSAYLERGAATEVSWQLYYLVLAGASVLFVGAVLLGLPGFGAIPQLAAAFVVTLAFLGLALVHFYYQRQDTLELPPSEERSSE